jgi:predicted transcriptional regulator
MAMKLSPEALETFRGFALVLGVMSADSGLGTAAVAERTGIAQDRSRQFLTAARARGWAEGNSSEGQNDQYRITPAGRAAGDFRGKALILDFLSDVTSADVEEIVDQTGLPSEVVERLLKDAQADDWVTSSGAGGRYVITDQGKQCLSAMTASLKAGDFAAAALALGTAAITAGGVLGKAYLEQRGETDRTRLHEEAETERERIRNGQQNYVVPPDDLLD